MVNEGLPQVQYLGQTWDVIKGELGSSELEGQITLRRNALPHEIENDEIYLEISCDFKEGSSSKGKMLIERKFQSIEFSGEVIGDRAIFGSRKEDVHYKGILKQTVTPTEHYLAHTVGDGYFSGNLLEAYGAAVVKHIETDSENSRIEEFAGEFEASVFKKGSLTTRDKNFTFEEIGSFVPSVNYKNNHEVIHGDGKRKIFENGKLYDECWGTFVYGALKKGVYIRYSTSESPLAKADLNIETGKFEGDNAVESIVNDLSAIMFSVSYSGKLFVNIGLEDRRFLYPHYYVALNLNDMNASLILQVASKDQVIWSRKLDEKYSTVQPEIDKHLRQIKNKDIKLKFHLMLLTPEKLMPKIASHLDLIRQLIAKNSSASPSNAATDESRSESLASPSQNAASSNAMECKEEIASINSRYSLFPKCKHHIKRKRRLHAEVDITLYLANTIMEVKA
ncbi:MAG: hypothetical protein A3F18_04415 [Legionellales bacterium RIFCSPHIGHO2_12_FULL_37_14]|nr:MAG: hypothetical protein A3F18_04415 [Legionellales bacterium RIFCSPHIGHO2_12_FULL_37_14]